MTDWYIGTMGFSYKDWSGVFYPQDMPARSWLTYYSRIFNAAEIDSTFYGTPRIETVKRWAAQTPEGFRFSLKVPRVITHDLSLVGVAGLMQEFVTVVETLGKKLGVILVQFPPSFDASRHADLDVFLSELPRGPSYAVEVRDQSWYTAENETAALFEKHGVAWAATQYPGLPRNINVTAPFIYIRWIGRHGSFDHHTHERLDRTTDLKSWWEKIHAVQDRLESVYGFTNNDYAGFAPMTANRFKEIAGLPVEPLRPAQQPTLF